MAKILMFKTESKRVIGRQVVRFINFIKWGLAEKICLVFMTILCRNEICVIFNGKFILKKFFTREKVQRRQLALDGIHSLRNRSTIATLVMKNILWN